MLEITSPRSFLGDGSTENSSADMRLFYGQFLGESALL
jgi:hypothetical protein